ncbi:MAG: hypothetical protein GY725_14755 [bacterium]|nr:hypothetical protein [bacterium]
MSELKLIVYSDYLCPWCHVASHRLNAVVAEFGDRVELEWRSYLLRPFESSKRDLEKFKRYTQSWARPAGEEDSPEFSLWKTEFGPPSHSIPAHVVTRAAAAIGSKEFQRVHERLLCAYFVENLDISDEETLRRLWLECGLEEALFPPPRDPDLGSEILEEHNAAIDLGVTGVPAVQIAGDDVVITGAHPRELYRRWITRRLAAD